MYKIMNVSDTSDNWTTVIETIDKKIVKDNNDMNSLKKLFILMGMIDIPYIYPRIDGDTVYLNALFISVMNSLCKLQNDYFCKDVFSLLKREFPSHNFEQTQIAEDPMFTRHIGIVVASVTSYTIKYKNTPVYYYLDNTTLYVYTEDGKVFTPKLGDGEIVKLISDASIRNVLSCTSEYTMNILSIDDIIYTEQTVYRVLPGIDLYSTKFMSKIDARLMNIIFGLPSITMDEYLANLSKNELAKLEFKRDILLRDIGMKL